ncbi:MAG: stage II sporulation protein R [Erysipelotrichales bacterium]|nr:stage II sporulation protein R [Erysipelotrichales bacterium]
MKKLVFIFFIIVGIMLLLPEEANDPEVRLRIMANSNTQEDIEIKNQVKEQVTVFLTNILTEEKRVFEVINIIGNNILLLEAELNTSFSEEIDVRFTRHLFPVKSRNGIVTESRHYDTLLITINEGNGDNFWTTLFPNLFGATGEVEYRWFILEWFGRR